MLQECMHASSDVHAHAHSHTIHKVIASENDEAWTPEIMQQLQVIQNNAHASNGNSCYKFKCKCKCKS
jgi:hypothetical protein